MTHPCDGHPCDGCEVCQSGKCCLTAPSEVLPPNLRVAVQAEIEEAPSFAQTIRLELTLGGVPDVLHALVAGEPTISIITTTDFIEEGEGV
jgi:hypothetical protein